MLTSYKHFWAYVIITSSLSKDLVTYHQTFDSIDNDQPRIYLKRGTQISELSKNYTFKLNLWWPFTCNLFYYI
jgi:hypothetical protein